MVLEAKENVIDITYLAQNKVSSNTIGSFHEYQQKKYD